MCLPFSILTFLALFRCTLSQGDGTFEAPWRIPTPHDPISVTTGNFNGDGRPDLALAQGTQIIDVLIRGPSGRGDWKVTSLQAGLGIYSIRAEDFNGDGYDDLIAADPATNAYYFKCRGDGTFEEPVTLVRTQGSRDIATGDWNNDGNLDLAAANHDNFEVTIHFGNGDGTFVFTEATKSSGEPHGIAALDYNGDGNLDLMIAMGPWGYQLLRGDGTGGFDALPETPGFFSHLMAADFNGDGRDDVITFGPFPGYSGTSYQVWLNEGEGKFTMATMVPHESETLTLADMNGDGALDLILGGGSSLLRILPGKGDGTFNGVIQIGQIFSSSLTARDLDGDGLEDIISAGPTGLWIFRGDQNERLVEWGSQLRRINSAGGMALEDLDGDGGMDLFFPSSRAPEIDVFLKPSLDATVFPSFTIRTSEIYSSLKVTDLDGDGVPDLAGVNRAGGEVLLGLLDASGNVRRETVLSPVQQPWMLAAGRIDQGSEMDLAVACIGPESEIAIFLSRGGGDFAGARVFPTIPGAHEIVLGDADSDGHRDLLVLSAGNVALHRGAGTGEFSEPIEILGDPEGNFFEGSMADLDGDSIPDLCFLNGSKNTMIFLRGRGNLEFGSPRDFFLNGAPRSLSLADLNGDGLLDVTAANFTGRGISVLINRGGGEFSDPAVYYLGTAPQGHGLADFDGDGVLDLIGYRMAAAVILRGRPGELTDSDFRRGDADRDGRIGLTDVILAITYQFIGGVTVECLDAADIDDDGEVSLADAIRSLSFQFAGELDKVPEPPGPFRCGPDVGDDDLPPCRYPGEVCSP